MIETKYLISSLAWRGIRLSTKVFAKMCRELPAHVSEKQLLEALSGEFRLKLSFEKGWFAKSQADIEWLWRFGARLITILDADYPQGLREFRDAPLALAVKGAAIWTERNGISIVGSRHPSPSSLRWLDFELDAFLQNKDVYVASGGARGIDQKAHAVALRKNRPTVCFVPAGLGALYPAQLESWVQPIVEGGGAFISTYAPNRLMEKNLFIERNRYIAAISQSTLIVEAKRRSGTLVTARWATALDRPIGVVPCSPSAAGLGGLDILADDGVLIRDYKDLIILNERASVKTLKLFGENEYRDQGQL